jgi:hypothetical protein
MKTLHEAEQTAAMVFFRFMGISGWLTLLLIIVSGVAFMPSQYGGHDILWFEWILAIAIWLCARWGTHFKNKWQK